MPPTESHALAAAGTLQRISETERGERARRAAAGALVLRAVERAMAGDAGSPFLVARARADVEALAPAAERSTLGRIVLLLEEDAPAAALAEPLVSYACALERTRRLPEADAAMTLARAFAPDDGATALHAGRVARKLGERERALSLYTAARELDGGDGTLSRLARIGEAVVSAHPERALTRAVREALRAGDAEAAAVGLEERAALRRAAGRRRAAARDLCLAAVRFADPVDRSRVAHELASVALAARDSASAREALRVALAWGDGKQRDHARARLHTLSRDVDDQVGMRRWRSFQRPPLVSLSAYRPVAGALDVAPRLARWREAMERRTCAGSPGSATA